MPRHPTLPTPSATREREKIPAALLRAMFGLALASLIIVTYAVVTKRPHEGVPAAGTPVAERSLILEGKDAQAVVVRDADGQVLMDLPHGGFITVIQSAVARARVVARVDGNPPVRIIRYDNGRLVAEDPATGWSAELYAFGDDNKAAFERLISDQPEK